MSVTMHLYKESTASYVGNYLDFISSDLLKLDDDGYYGLEHYEKELGAPMKEDGHWPDNICGDELYEKHSEWEEAQRAKAWSDGKEHDKIDITMLKCMFSKERGWRRLRDRLSKFNIQTFNGKTHVAKYIAVDEVGYAQGWFFKTKFFKKKVSFVVCTTKEQMEKFFNRYIDFNSRFDARGRMAVNDFLSKWEDGMIFVCAW